MEIWLILQFLKLHRNMIMWHTQWSKIYWHVSPNRCRHTGDVFKVSLYGKITAGSAVCQCQVLWHWITAFIVSKWPDSALLHCQRCPCEEKSSPWLLLGPDGLSDLEVRLWSCWHEAGSTAVSRHPSSCLSHSGLMWVGDREPWIWLNDQRGLCGLLQSFKSLCGSCSE